MSIGRIIVDLLARTGSFETDMNRSAKLAAKRAKEIDEAFKKAGQAVGLALAGMATAAAAAFRSSVNRMDDLSKAALRVSLPTDQFSALVYAGELADVSMNDLQTTLSRLNRSMADAQKAGSEQARIFEALDISTKSADGTLRNRLDVLKDFADRFKEFGGGQEIIAAGVKLFGRQFEQVIPLLKDGSAGFASAAEEAKAFGLIVEAEAGRAAEAFNDNLTRLGKPLQGIGNLIAAGVLPSMISLGDELVNVAKETGALRGAADVGVTGLKILASAAIGVGAVFMAMGESIAAIVTGLTLVAKGEFKAAVAAMDISADEIQSIIERTQKLLGAIWNPPKAAAAPDAGGGTAGEDAKKRLAALMAALAGNGKSVKTEAEKAAEAVAKMLAKIEGDIARFGLNDHQKQLLDFFDAGATVEELARADELIRKYQALKDARKLTEDADATRLKMLADRVRESEELERQAQAWMDMADPMREFIRNLEKVDEMVSRGLLSPEMAEGIKKLLAGAKEELSEMDQFMKNAAENIQKSLGDELFNVLDGNFDNIGKSFSNMLKRMVAESLAADITRALFGKTGVGGFFGSLFGLAGTRASGGPVSAGKTYLVGEQGPEFFTPTSSGRILPNGTAPASGGATVVQHINVGSGVSYNDVMAAMLAAKEEAKREIYESTRRGGAFA